MTAAGDPLLICYDGSDDAKHAITEAGRLFGGRHALVLTLWDPAGELGSLALSGISGMGLNFVELDRAAAENGGKLAAAGVRIAEDAGLEAEALPVKASAPIWKMILETAQRHNAAAIVMGSRGLRGVRSMLLGSVSSAVTHHADRPTVIIRHPNDRPAGVEQSRHGASAPGVASASRSENGGSGSLENGDERPLAWPSGT